MSETVDKIGAIKNIIYGIVLDNPGISHTELTAEAVQTVILSGMTNKNVLPALIYEMADNNELVELEYVQEDTSHKISSMFWPPDYFISVKNIGKDTFSILAKPSYGKEHETILSNIVCFCAGNIDFYNKNPFSR